ncbi:DNA polymerase III subunit chi [Cellvibrio polysaccharolyticus]|uniref:DNA polymerase III subunit chi n=1 Tax=Cellvibrio polysaccharolyticus TaxID=2082724 RepID=A0A928YUW2_9GAMM|nr:DNA polymerase III subunit chi [Cellvibrio polysaccharolyticus]MBE8717915.1 DNA polymerase III subunit chi [Cellvibrio polysaccharolyticus]
MTRIDFYILQDNASEARWHFACRLIEKAVRQGHRILVNLGNSIDGQAFDDLLWSFKPESFIPHCLADDANAAAAQTPVLIYQQAPAKTPFPFEQSLLINLAEEVPTVFSQFERLSEIVIQEENVLKNTREHYHFYRKGGYSIEHRKI